MRPINCRYLSLFLAADFRYFEGCDRQGPYFFVNCVEIFQS
jgi:hypothetical protein